MSLRSTAKLNYAKEIFTNTTKFMNAHDPLFPTGRRGKDVPGGVGMWAASGHQTGPGSGLLVPLAAAAKVLADPPVHVVEGGADLRTIRLSNTRHRRPNKVQNAATGAL